jgi:DNA-directed RNA polymerase specialized sigma24 family protein
MDGLSYEEIAQTLDIGLSATKMRIKRAREEFRRLFGELEDSPSRRAGGGPDEAPAGERDH